MVHQELSLCPHLTVAENLLLGMEPSRFGFVQSSAARDRVARALREIGRGDDAENPLDPQARVAELSPADRQLVEIARAVAQTDCRVLILDEPTSSLTSHDVKQLFEVVGRLRAKGLTIIYISHFLEEVQAIADAYTVLRDGQTVGEGEMAGAKMADIVGQMVGRQISEFFPRSQRTPGAVILEVAGLAAVDKPSDASLMLRRGEVLGIAGLVGAGRTELLRAIYGLDPVKSGKVRVGAYVGPASPARRLRQGMGLVSEDRKGEGLAGGMSIADNLTLSKLSGLGPLGLVMPERKRAVVSTWIKRLGIRCRDPDESIGHLSGGNQQKVALARLLYHDVDVFLLDEPTRGIDVGSKAQIYELVDRLAAEGKAVLLVSSYLPELFGICDLIAVMRRGKLGAARPTHELTEHGVLTEATGT
jgi:ribose transport system ATP-binding protein